MKWSIFHISSKELLFNFCQSALNHWRLLACQILDWKTTFIDRTLLTLFVRLKIKIWLDLSKQLACY